MKKKIDLINYRCTQCKNSAMEKAPESIVCGNCGNQYAIKNNKVICQIYSEDEVVNFLDKIKYKIKKYDSFYYFLINIISPVYPDNRIKKFLKEEDSHHKLILNLGSGNSKIANNILNIDMFPYDNVDIACDITQIPIKDNSVDIIVNLGVLEHVPNPTKVLKEAQRILKPDGKIFTAIPFIQGFHASPHDYGRFTKAGIFELHKSLFSAISIHPFGGPTSGMLWIVQEWIAITLSFGSKRLHAVIYIMTMLLLFPLKFFDFFLIHHPLCENIASGFIYIGKKEKI